MVKDIYQYDEVSKRNRRQKLDADKQKMVVGPRPLVISRKELRKERDKRINLAVKDALK